MECEKGVSEEKGATGDTIITVPVKVSSNVTLPFYVYVILSYISGTHTSNLKFCNSTMVRIDI